jgi:hypothetical protein
VNERATVDSKTGFQCVKRWPSKEFGEAWTEAFRFLISIIWMKIKIFQLEFWLGFIQTPFTKNSGERTTPTES